jgi:four helix bundle protein
MYKELLAYKKAYEQAMKVFKLSLKFPKEERFSMTDQMRRSSRSVCANIAEAYRRRRYENYFISKLNDSDSENAETEVWLNFAKDCGYIDPDDFAELTQLNSEMGKLIGFMLHHPEKFYAK